MDAPFHLVALLALVVGLDVIALNGPTLKMLGVNAYALALFRRTSADAFSIVLNGLLFLALMLVTERSRSLDLRRASKLLEVLAIIHTLSALFVNAMNHRGDPHVRMDAWLYLGAAAHLYGACAISLTLAIAGGRTGRLWTGQLFAGGLGFGGP